jgi:hypothetical protein
MIIQSKISLCFTLIDNLELKLSTPNKMSDENIQPKPEGI